MLMTKPQISFEDFLKLDIRVGEVTEAAEVPGSEKLLKLTVNFGQETGLRTIFSGIKKWYNPSSLQGRKLAFITNLPPKKFKIKTEEYESEGMILAADSGEEAILYQFDKEVEPGSVVR